MIARALISKNIEALHHTITEKEAKKTMRRNKLFHLPVISENSCFLGLLAEEDLNSISKTDTIEQHPEKLSDIKIYAHQHVFEIFDVLFKQNLSCIPVIEDTNTYIGLITNNDAMSYFSKLFMFETRGAIIILTVLIQDYNLSQISRIIEENNAKIISLFTSTNEDSNKMDITLKLNTHEISSIIQTFNRFDYTIKTYFEGYDKLQEMYKDRIDSLLNYLNI